MRHVVFRPRECASAGRSRSLFSLRVPLLRKMFPTPPNTSASKRSAVLRHNVYSIFASLPAHCVPVRSRSGAPIRKRCCQGKRHQALCLAGQGDHQRGHALPSSARHGPGLQQILPRPSRRRLLWRRQRSRYLPVRLLRLEPSRGPYLLLPRQGRLRLSGPEARASPQANLSSSTYQLPSH